MSFMQDQMLLKKIQNRIVLFILSLFSLALSFFQAVLLGPAVGVWRSEVSLCSLGTGITLHT